MNEKTLHTILNHLGSLQTFLDLVEFPPGEQKLRRLRQICRKDLEKIKDLLNIKVKKREWYQPFCPSVLDTESRKLFKDVNSFDSFMTMAYLAKEEKIDGIKSVINVDGSSRPQMLQNENSRYRRLIKHVKKNTGNGIVLNTSFNLHGFPIVLTPKGLFL